MSTQLWASFKCSSFQAVSGSVAWVPGTCVPTGRDTPEGQLCAGSGSSQRTESLGLRCPWWNPLREGEKAELSLLGAVFSHSAS